MKIAFIAFHFSPDEPVAAVRADNWAKWLSEEHELVVITRETLVPYAEMASAFRVVRPTSLLTRWIERNKLRRKRARADIVSKQTDRQTDRTMVKKLRSGVFFYRMPCQFDVWFLACYRALRRERPDIVIATHGPYISLVVAWVYSRLNRRVFLWLDFRDLWCKNPNFVGVPFFRSIERWIESKAISSADLVSTVSAGLREYFQDKVDEERSVVIYNAPSDDVNLVPAQNRKSSGLVICYTGNIYGNSQDLSPLFEMFARLRDSNGLSPDQVRLKVASQNPENLFSSVAQSKTRDFLDYVGSVPRHESIRMQKSSDILLLLGSTSPDIKGVLTGKVFEYLATDKPILLIGSEPDSELHRLLVHHQRLITLEEVGKALSGSDTLPTCTAVDYSMISRRQLHDAVERLLADKSEQ